MPPVALRPRSIGYLAAPRLTAQSSGTLKIHSAFRQTLNLQLRDERLLPLISAHSSLNHPDAVRVAVSESWDWRQVDALVLESGTLICRFGHIALKDVPVWTPPESEEVSQSALVQLIPFLEQQLREWCRLHSVDSVLRLLPDDSFGIPVEISLSDSEEKLAAMADATLGFGGGLTPDGDDYLLGYFAALHASTSNDATEHRQRLARVVTPRLGRTNDISRHYLQRAAEGHFSEAICQLRTQLAAPFSPQEVGARAAQVMAFGAASGADCMAGFLHGLRNLSTQ